MALRIGIDLGGSKIEGVVLKLAEADQPGPPEVLSRKRIPTERTLGYQHIVDAVAGLITDVAAEAGLPTDAAALPPIGVGMPGSVTRARRTVKNSNTVCLNGRPFREDLIARVGRPIAFSNDANCFALAEARYGAGRGGQVVFGVIMGTGVGGGIALSLDERPPQVWDGPQGIAGEWGHVSLEPTTGKPCYCGRRGCIETLLSGPAIEAEYEQRTGVRRPVAELALRHGDPVAVAVLAELCASFGRALATVINILDPEIIVLGGGVSNLDVLYEQGIIEVARWVFNDELTTRIVRHQLGDSAGVYGAALLPTDL